MRNIIPILTLSLSLGACMKHSEPREFVTAEPPEKILKCLRYTNTPGSLFDFVGPIDSVQTMEHGVAVAGRPYEILIKKENPDRTLVRVTGMEFHPMRSAKARRGDVINHFGHCFNAQAPSSQEPAQTEGEQAP